MSYLKNIQFDFYFFKIFFEVISKSAANGLACRGLNCTESTEKFVRMCGQFFDCLNDCNTLERHMKKRTYRDRNDWRIKVFLGFDKGLP